MRHRSMTRRLGLLTATAVIACSVLPALSQAVLLTGPQATHYSVRAVKAHPKMGYTNGFEKKINCHAISRVRKECEMQWDVGQALLKGESTITLRPNRGGASYHLNFKAFDRNCQCTYDYPNWRGFLPR